MKCIYCGGGTQVINSRHQKRANKVWRRRECKKCEAVFTTLEGADLEQAVRVRREGRLEPFSRDKLLLSVYDSLRHRKSPTEDATALTETIIGKMFTLIQNAAVERDTLTEVTSDVLHNFDTVAATHYKAFHP